MCRFLKRLKIELSFAIEIVVQLLSHVQLFVTPWTVAHQAPLSSTISQSLLKFMAALVNSFCCQFSFKTWGLPSRSSQTVSLRTMKEPA